jgi:hypothetical protein
VMTTFHMRIRSEIFFEKDFFTHKISLISNCQSIENHAGSLYTC